MGEAANTAVDVAEAGAKIMDIIREENAKAVEQARKDNNEFNACKSFIDNALILIKSATLNQYNVVIVTDQAHDVWWQDKPGVSGLPRNIFQPIISHFADFFIARWIDRNASTPNDVRFWEIL
jgi:hypothetical protein